MTVWRPDTCACEFVVNNDYTLAAEGKKCAVHESEADVQSAFIKVLAENRIRGFARSAVYEALPVEEKEAIKEIDIPTSINEDRTVTVVLPDNVKADKPLFEAAVTEKFNTYKTDLPDLDASKVILE